MSLTTSFLKHVFLFPSLKLFTKKGNLDAAGRPLAKHLNNSVACSFFSWCPNGPFTHSDIKATINNSSVDQEPLGKFDILLGVIDQELHPPHIFFTHVQVFLPNIDK